jgi:hypothetical protein
MRKSIRLKVGVIGTIFRTGRRHQGRHRCGSSSSPKHDLAERFGRTNLTPDRPPAATEDHRAGAATSEDVPVAAHHAPALSNGLGS